MSEQTPDPAGKVSARRRLLRGTFAVPTVLTLSSGSALAATSALRCFDNSTPGVTDPPNNYFRVQRYTQTTGSVTTKLVKTIDITNLTVNGFSASEYTSGKDEWIRVSDGANFPIQGQGVGVTPVPEPETFVALRFDRDGGTDAEPTFKVTGLATSVTVYSGSGRVMTHSCWASI